MSARLETQRARATLGMVETSDWRTRGICRDLGDPEVMYRDSPLGVYEAKRVCQPCPMRDLCLMAGLHEEHGVWGGLSPRERKAYSDGAPVLVCDSCGLLFARRAADAQVCGSCDYRAQRSELSRDQRTRERLAVAA